MRKNVEPISAMSSSNGKEINQKISDVLFCIDPQVRAAAALAAFFYTIAARSPGGSPPIIVSRIAKVALANDKKPSGFHATVTHRGHRAPQERKEYILHELGHIPGAVRFFFSFVHPFGEIEARIGESVPVPGKVRRRESQSLRRDFPYHRSKKDSIS